MKDELYKKIYIKSESDLPKEMATLFFFNNKIGEGFDIVVNPLDKGCMNNLLLFHWYLQPIAQPKISAEEMLAKYNIYQNASINPIGKLIIKAMHEYASQRVEREVSDSEIMTYFNNHFNCYSNDERVITVPAMTRSIVIETVRHYLNTMRNELKSK